MRGPLTAAFIASLASCTALIDASGLSDEYGRDGAAADVGVDSSAVDSATVDTASFGDVTELPPPDSGHDCEQRLRDGVRYLLCKEELTYEQAEIVCKSDFGARLVVIHDETEQAFLHSWLFARRSAWIGLDDRKVELDYRWVDGSALTYSNWRTGPTEDWNDCVWMETGGTWIDRMCNNPSIVAWYFCEGPG